MADWKRLAAAVLRADGRLSPAAAAAVRAAVGADGTADKDEVEFVADLRRAVPVPPEFDRWALDLVKQAVLHDGRISAPEAGWLRQLIFADGRVSAAERDLLKELAASAAVTCPEFDELVHEHQSI